MHLAVAGKLAITSNNDSMCNSICYLHDEGEHTDKNTDTFEALYFARWS
jgi:hypothetical protein